MQQQQFLQLNKSDQKKAEKLNRLEHLKHQFRDEIKDDKKSKKSKKLASPRNETPSKTEERERKELLRMEIKLKVKERIDSLMSQEMDKVRKPKPESEVVPTKMQHQLTTFDDLSSVNQPAEGRSNADFDEDFDDNMSVRSGMSLNSPNPTKRLTSGLVQSLGLAQINEEN